MIYHLVQKKEWNDMLWPLLYFVVLMFGYFVYKAGQDEPESENAASTTSSNYGKYFWFESAGS